MATINYDYQEDKILYDSGPVEDYILNKYKNGEEVTYKDKDCFYSYAPARENIVNWYPFKKNSTILELGGGIGSVTGALCQKAKKVVSCEYSAKRAESLYFRHKDKKNLEVVVGNFKKINFKQKFDYIVLIGVFEYAKRFYDTDNPFEDFLLDIKKLLNPSGVILIAIENRYGIKYWAGATEDHLGKKYIGMYGYDNLDIVTFGKQELIDIVENSGFKNYKFYYPYPDYKMPYIIHTDDRLPQKNETKNMFIYNYIEQYYNFDYRRTINDLIKNKQYDFFANSFMLEISNDKESISDITFAKAFWYRSNAYGIITILNNDIVIKRALTNQAKDHLKKMLDTNQIISNFGLKVPKMFLNNDELSVQKIHGIDLCEKISYLTEVKDKESIIFLINKYYDILLKISIEKSISNATTKRQEKFFRDKKIKVLKIGLIDLHMSNIILNGDDYYIIDQEWCSNYSIPTNYMLYVSLLFLYINVYGLENLIPFEDILIKYNIRVAERKIYDEMSEFFSNKEFQNIDKEKLELFLAESNMTFIDDKIEQLNKEIDYYKLRDQNNHLEIINLKSVNKSINHENAILLERLKSIDSENIRIDLENTRIDLENKKIKEEILDIYNSKIYKILKLIRKVRRKKNEI